jgi:hypothetical protein
MRRVYFCAHCDSGVSAHVRHSECDVRDDERRASKHEPQAGQEQLSSVHEQPHASTCELGSIPEQRHAVMKEARAGSDE